MLAVHLKLIPHLRALLSRQNRLSHLPMHSNLVVLLVLPHLIQHLLAMLHELILSAIGSLQPRNLPYLTRLLAPFGQNLSNRVLPLTQQHSPQLELRLKLQITPGLAQFPRD